MEKKNVVSFCRGGRSPPMGTTNTFEISQQSPFNGGFSIASDQTQGTDSMVISTKGGSSGTYSDFYFNMSLYDAQGLFYGCDREYSQAINYKIDTVDPSDWTPSGSYSHGSITVKKGNLSPSDFSGGILIELILGNKINGYVKRVMLRIKIN